VDDDHGVDETEHRALDEHGRILRDNLYGTIEEDVWRRDFTANALYYNIEDYSIWDYVGGVPDARDRILRLIGDPETRYREDPVRMLRAARFAAKLDFTLHEGTERPVHELGYMLDRMPPARLFDETMKLMLSGHAMRSFEWLARLELLPHLMPDVASALEEAPESPAARLLALGLEGTDDRVHDDKSVTPTFPVRRVAVARDPARSRRAQRLNAAGPAALARRVRSLDRSPVAAHRGAEAVFDPDARTHAVPAALRASVGAACTALA
jgi:poly(A) polymerase